MSKTMSRKAIKQAYAEDITTYPAKDVIKLLSEINKEEIGISFGLYGVNGYLFEDTNTGNQYKVTARNSNLFIVM